MSKIVVGQSDYYDLILIDDISYIKGSGSYSDIFTK